MDATFWLLNVTSPFGGVNVYRADTEDDGLRIFEEASCRFSLARRVELKDSNGTLIKEYVAK